MTGRMSHETDELEQHLSDQLHGIGGLAPDADGWEGIHHRLDRRRRARTRARVGGVAFVLMAVVAVLIPLAGRGDRRTQVASDPQGFPRLILDLPGYDLVHADSSEDTRDETTPGSSSSTATPAPGCWARARSCSSGWCRPARHTGSAATTAPCSSTSPAGRVASSASAR